MTRSRYQRPNKSLFPEGNKLDLKLLNLPECVREHGCVANSPLLHRLLKSVTCSLRKDWNLDFSHLTDTLIQNNVQIHIYPNVLFEEKPCRHGEYMQAPHRKALGDSSLQSYTPGLDEHAFFMEGCRRVVENWQLKVKASIYVLINSSYHVLNRDH